MKRATLITTISAAAVVVAGGVGAYALTTQDTPETPATEATQTPTGSPTPDATPSAEPTPLEVTPTAHPAPSEPSYGSPEEEFVARASDQLADWGYSVPTDEEILSAGLYLCEEVAAGTLPHDATAFGDVGKLVYTGIYAAAEETIC